MMEQTASTIADLARRRSTAGNGASMAKASACQIHWFRRGEAPSAEAARKRIAILDPSGIERRLLAALSQALGHQVAVYRTPEDLLAALQEARPEIAFVHICF